MLIYSKYSTAPQGRRIRFSTRRAGLTLLVGTTALLVLLKVATWLNAQEMFTLKDIRIEGNRFVSEEEILSLLHVGETHSLFEVDLKALAEQARQHPWVLQVWASRRLPDDIIIKVREREPLALLNNGGSMNILDGFGKVLPDLPTVERLDVPIISGVAMDTEGTQKRELETILNFLHLLRLDHFSLYSRISEISSSPELGMYFYLIERTIPVIVGEGDITAKTSNLIEVLRFVEQEDSYSEIKCIDLRYKDQVIIKRMSS